MTAKPMGKSRPESKPYLVVVNGSWTYKVLKAYTSDPDKPFARWFASVSSPMTFGSSDLGDTYISEVRGTLVYADPEVPVEALPGHLRYQLVAAQRVAGSFGKTSSSIHTLPEGI